MNEKPRYWRSNSTLARWTCGVLVGQAMLNIVCMFLHEANRWYAVRQVLQTTDVDNSAFNRRVQDAMNTSNSVWFSLAGYAFTASLVLLIVWSHRSATNALALGRTHARQSPGWVIAGWLVPILNIVLPYQTMSDLWRSSDPEAARGDRWRERGPVARVIAWWLCFQSFNIAYVAAILLMLTGDSTPDQASPWFAAARAGIAVAALLGAWLVWDITQRQEHQNALDPAVTREQAQVGADARGYQQAGHPQAGYPQAGFPQVAQQVVTGPNGLPTPGWYVDPSGLFDFRYWDGVAWTEHVSRGGIAALAPVAPTPPALPTIAPDWFPDPSGRHQWRYWGGDDWTPHVSDDDVHTDDPLDAPAPRPVPHLPA